MYRPPLPWPSDDPAAIAGPSRSATSGKAKSERIVMPRFPMFEIRRSSIWQQPHIAVKTGVHVRLAHATTPPVLGEDGAPNAAGRRVLGFARVSRTPIA